MITLRHMMLPAMGLLAVVAVACGGGGGGTTTPPTKSVPSASQVTVRVVVPSAAKSSLTPQLRRRFSEAQSTAGLLVQVYPNPQGTSAPVLTQTEDISATSALCTTNTDLSRSCTFPLTLAAATYNFSVSSYDQVPVAGTIPAAAVKLGISNFSSAITVGSSQTLSLSMNGIAASVNVVLPVPIVRTLDKLTEQAIVSVLDPDNDVIVANSYVDSSGNPVTVNLTSNCPLTTWGVSSFTTPSGNGFPVTWDPTNITASEMSGGQVATVTATLSNNSATGTATLTAPAAAQAISVGAVPYGITAQSSTSTLWVTEPTSNQIQNIVPSTNTVAATVSVTSSSGPIGPTPGPRDILYAPDGNLWMTFNNTGAIGKIATGGCCLNGTTLYTGTNGVSLASDGTNVWTLQPSGPYLEYTPLAAFSVTEYNPVGATGMFQIVTGTGGAEWFTNSTASTSTMIGLAGPLPGTGQYYGPALSSGANPEGIAWDGNQTMYVAENGTSKIAVIAGPCPAGSCTATVTEYATGGVAPIYIAVGPDGNAWFDYSSPTPGVGRITPSGTVSLFPLPTGTVPGQMVTLGTQVWLVDTATTTIYGISP